ncbi:DUF1311 domain-containing protein [bacterium]|nr:DUF1311 domain-containing protein [bacterium]
MGNLFRWKLLTFLTIFSILSLNVFANPACKNDDWGELKKIMENLTCELDDNKQLTECLNNTCGINMAINDCFNNMVKKCETIMNNIYNKKLEESEKIIYKDEFNEGKGSEKQRLENSQTYWKQYTDSYCNVNINFNSSNAGNNILECKLKKIKERIIELQNIY